jgi:hypothetical protein
MNHASATDLSDDLSVLKALIVEQVRELAVQ